MANDITATAAIKLAEATVESTVINLSDIDNAPETLRNTTQQKTETPYAELLDKFTVVSNENFELRTDIDQLRKAVQTATILDGLIEPYAEKAFKFMWWYCGVVGAIVIASGIQIPGFDVFQEPEHVLEIMVGSTAVTVIGLVGMVLTGIFVGARKGG